MNTQLTNPAVVESRMPSQQRMQQAFFDKDSQFDGIFYVAVKTTGIFCRSICPARRPKPENIEFYATVRDALFAGYRACKRCRPMDPHGAKPKWLVTLIDDVVADPTRRWKDQDLRERDVDPVRARRWFQKEYGITFHAYARAIRLGTAIDHLNSGEPVTQVGFGHGFESLSGFSDAMKRATGLSPGEARKATRIIWRRIPTLMGPMVAAATQDALVLLEFADRRALEKQCLTVCRRFNAVLAPGTNRILDRTERELEDYFSGAREKFEVSVLTPGTEFQELVWNQLRQIDFGQTASYAQLAKRLGKPAAVRAVGKANGDNRIAIIIPCHRVVGSNGDLTGYAGGIWRKKKLLELENGRR